MRSFVDTLFDECDTCISNGSWSPNVIGGGLDVYAPPLFQGVFHGRVAVFSVFYSLDERWEVCCEWVIMWKWVCVESVDNRKCLCLRLCKFIQMLVARKLFSYRSYQAIVLKVIRKCGSILFNCWDGCHSAHAETARYVSSTDINTTYLKPRTNLCEFFLYTYYWHVQ